MPQDFKLSKADIFNFLEIAISEDDGFWTLANVCGVQLPDAHGPRVQPEAPGLGLRRALYAAPDAPCDQPKLQCSLSIILHTRERRVIGRAGICTPSAIPLRMRR